MKQIGARQEAGRIGGLGACGRELVLRVVDVELFERHDRSRARAGHFAQPPEAGRAVLVNSSAA